MLTSLSVLYILYRTLSLVSAFQKIVTIQEMKLPLLYIGAQMRYQLWALLF